MPENRLRADFRAFPRGLEVSVPSSMIPAILARWRKRTPSEVAVLLCGLGICLAVWMFIWVADEMGEDEHLPLEKRIMLALRDPRNLADPVGPPWLKQVAIDVSALGGATVIVLMSLAIGGMLLLRRRWRRATLLAVTIGGGHLLSYFLKVAYGRERPDVVPHLAQVDSASFPSGHSLSSSVIYLTMAALLAQGARQRREKLYLMAVAFGLTFLIGMSRVFLGVHYPSDVIAGWSAGTAWALACWVAASRLGDRRPPDQADGPAEAP